jgi:hypothetical protein
MTKIDAFREPGILDATLFATVLIVASGQSAATQELSAIVNGGAVVGSTTAEHSASATAGLDVETPRLGIGRSWEVGATGGAAWRPLFAMIKATPALAVAPAYRDGLWLSGGIRIDHFTERTETAVVARAGSARIDARRAALASNDIGDWAAFFDSGVDIRWIVPLVHVYAGVRHDQRFHRAGDLSAVRDPTGRIVLGAGAYPFRRGRFSAGASLEFERAWLGVSRLPSAMSVELSGRLRTSIWRH